MTPIKNSTLYNFFDCIYKIFFGKLGTGGGFFAYIFWQLQKSSECIEKYCKNRIEEALINKKCINHYIIRIHQQIVNRMFM